MNDLLRRHMGTVITTIIVIIVIVMLALQIGPCAPSATS